MKKIKLPLEMVNGVMVRTLDELKENWDLEKIVGYFGDGRLVTWLNDRYYTDLAEQVQKITAKGAEAQKQLCAVFGMEFKQDEVVDEEVLAERKRKLDILRKITSDDEILKNVDHVAFNQEDLADLLDEGVEKIYLCNGKFSVPLNISGKKYIGVADAEVYIGKDELQDFDKLGINFKNVKFDEKYRLIMEGKCNDFLKKAKELEQQGKYIEALECYEHANQYGILCDDVKKNIVKIEECVEKNKIIKQYTNSEKILSNLHQVVLSQSDLDFLDNDVEAREVYLVNGKYKIPLQIKNRHYFGLGKVECLIDSDEIVPFKSYNIYFEDTQFDERYKEIIRSIPRLKNGECIEFGCYCGHKIKWQVVDVVGSKAFLFCVDGIEWRQFCLNYVNTNWENSDIRKWLNGEFFESAFSSEEKKFISLSFISDEMNPQYYTNPGNSTFDHVFLMSLGEVKKYILGTELLYSNINDFLKSRGALAGNGGTCGWYMRSPGDSNSAVAYIRGGEHGIDAVRYCGLQVHIPCVIRPALWFDMDP